MSIASSVARWRRSAAPAASVATPKSFWAPPGGSGTISSARPEPFQIRGRELEGVGRLDLAGNVAPEDGGAGLGHGDAVDGVFHHEQAVADADSQRPAAAAFTDYQRHDRDACLGERHQVVRDRPGDATLLRARAGEGTGRVDEGHDRKLESFRLPDQPQGLAVALGVGHPEIAHRSFRRGAALLLRDDHDRPLVERGRPANDRVVVTEDAITVQLEEIAEDRVDVVERVGPVRVPGELALLPGGCRARSVVAHRGTTDAGAGLSA